MRNTQRRTLSRTQSSLRPGGGTSCRRGHVTRGAVATVRDADVAQLARPQQRRLERAVPASLGLGRGAGSPLVSHEVDRTK